MFPFRGLPERTQAIGNELPLTHYLQLVRGILLKGDTLHELAAIVADTRLRGGGAGAAVLQAALD